MKNSDKVIRRLEDFSNEMSFLRDILSDNQLKKFVQFIRRLQFLRKS